MVTVEHNYYSGKNINLLKLEDEDLGLVKQFSGDLMNMSVLLENGLIYIKFELKSAYPNGYKFSGGEFKELRDLTFRVTKYLDDLVIKGILAIEDKYLLKK